MTAPILGQFLFLGPTSGTALSPSRMLGALSASLLPADVRRASTAVALTTCLGARPATISPGRHHGHIAAMEIASDPAQRPGERPARDRHGTELVFAAAARLVTRIALAPNGVLALHPPSPWVAAAAPTTTSS